MKFLLGKLIRWYKTILILVVLSTVFSCNTGSALVDETDVFDAEATKEASQLIADANDNLKRIRVLYYNSRAKYNEFREALENRDSEKVKNLTTDLAQIINDGYILAENAKSKIAEAQEKDINEIWRRYLGLKEDSLDLQIKAFDFRKESVELFGNKFGTKDVAVLNLAKQKFLKNEESFNKYMDEAKKKNQEAVNLAKEAARQDKDRQKTDDE